MRIEQRTFYIADDGVEFRFREAAQERDRMLRLYAAFSERVDSAVLTDLCGFLETEVNEAINQFIENTQD